MTDHAKMLTALLVGAAAGAVVGLLFAPDKGSNLRGKLLKFGQDAEQKLEDYFNEGVSYARNKFEEGKSKAGALADEVQNKAEDVSRKADYAKDKFKTQGS